MIKRILIAIDFSDVSRRAAKVGAELARQCGAEIVFVTVLDVGDIRVAMEAGLHGFKTDEELHAQVRQWIDEQYAIIERETAATSHRDIRRGLAERELVEAITEHHADLAVMGAHGHAGKTVGSKTEHLVGHARVPVVVVPGA